MHLTPSEPGVTQHRFTVEQWHKMIEAGVLGEDDHLELVEGQVFAMTPQGKPHRYITGELNFLLSHALSAEYRVLMQAPLSLGATSEPEPDISVVLTSEAHAAPVHPRHALLVVEVADTSLAHDRQVKLPLYARAGIPEAWIVNVVTKSVEVHRGPLKTGKYKTRRVVGAHQVLTSSSLPTIKLKVADLFP